MCAHVCNNALMNICSACVDMLNYIFDNETIFFIKTGGNSPTDYINLNKKKILCT
jgi:hypothetical protein